MTRIAPLVSALLLASLLSSGCMGGGDDEPTTTPTPTASASASASTPPGIATAVSITRAPASSPAASMATVCWTVSGTGTVSHVAIHWDNASHALEPTRTFQDYNLGASYPNNQSAASPAGYALRADGAPFCTAATMPASGAIHVVAHVIDSTGAPGRLSAEREIRVGPASEASIRIQNFAYSPSPLTVAPGATVSVFNLDSQAHTVTASGGAFDTGDVPGGGSDSFTAPMSPGSYTYGCAYHPTMSGVLEVAG